MVKQHHQVKAAKQGNLQRFEQNTVFDDNLPDADEIEKLSKHDPNILTWLKERAEKEQAFRHKAFNDRLKLGDKHNSKEHNTVRFGMLLYSALVIGSGVASFYLLMRGYNLQGTIFASTAVFLAFVLIMGKRAPKPPSPPV